MSDKSPIRRRCRSVMLSGKEHERFHALGGSRWLRDAIDGAWDKLPASVREAAEKRAADPFWSSK